MMKYKYIIGPSTIALLRLNIVTTWVIHIVTTGVLCDYGRDYLSLHILSMVQKYHYIFEMLLVCVSRLLVYSVTT